MQHWGNFHLPQTFNDEDVKYLGIAIYKVLSLKAFLSPQHTMEFFIEVSDVNGDDVQFFSRCTSGLFDQETRSGYWDIPAEVPNYYPTVQFLAVDEHGASDVLFLNLEIYQEWDSGTWDTGLWDTGWWEDPDE